MICKCLNIACPLRENCLRATKEDGPNQPYTKLSPDPLTGKCEHYIRDYGDAGHSSYPNSEQ